MTTPAWKSRLLDGAVIGGTAAVVLVLSIVMLSLIFGRQQQNLLTDIRGQARAQVCVLILPADPVTGRDEGDVNSRCLVPNGIEPVDANGDGHIELLTGGG